MKCPKCGGHMEETDKRCPYCNAYNENYVKSSQNIIKSQHKENPEDVALFKKIIISASSVVAAAIILLIIIATL